MQTAKRYLMIAFSFAVALTVLVVLAPRTVHAITATLVQVVNTSLNPVQVREVNNNVDEFFATALCSGSGCGLVEALGSLPADSGSGFTVANTDAEGNAVQSLVINFVSGLCSAPNAGLQRQSAVNSVNGQSQIVNLFTISPPGNSLGAPSISQQVNMVIPPNSTVSIYALDVGAGACYLTVNGYYVANTTKPL